MIKCWKYFGSLGVIYTGNSMIFLVFVSYIVYNFYLNGDKYLLCLVKKIDN